jgi:glucose/arabinose dehydrogenase
MRPRHRSITAPAMALFAAFHMGNAIASAAADDASAVLIGNFAGPTHVAVAPGQPRLLFVVERPGRIQVLRDEVQLPRPFLDIADLVLGQPDPGAGNEEGLLSVAFPPNYDSSGRFYVIFTNNDGNVELNEFMRSANNSARADRGSRRVVLVIPHPGATNHNGGQLQFGPDGRLYISVGDGGAGPPRGEPARDLNSLLGKILRIDPLPGPAGPYRIPRSNPFVGEGRGEVFAYGLRNPWRFSFDGGRIAIGDVGQFRREEINFLRLRDARGVNFGWPQYEGNLVFDDTRPGPHPAKFPIRVYGHGGNRCAVVGGYVVRDPNLAALVGRYLYGDACTGVIRSFIPRVGVQQAADDRATGLMLPRISSFGQGFGGKLYTTQITGEVFRLEPPAP